MNQYVTRTIIKELRERNKMTQLQLADKLGVTDKTISKWETGKGYPDIMLLEPIADAFSISVTELISGSTVSNANVSANMLRSKFYVCPVCGNVIHTISPVLLRGNLPLPYQDSPLRTGDRAGRKGKRLRTGQKYGDRIRTDRKSTRLNSSHFLLSRMPSSA